MVIENNDYVERRFIFTLVAACLASTFLLLTFTEFPRLSILTVDCLFCIFIAHTFRKFKSRLLFLLHPLIIWIANQFYVVPFLELGDGPQIITTLRHYLDTTTWTLDPNGVLIGVFHPNLLAGFRQLSFGTVPIILVPEYLYVRPASEVYFLWQSTFAIILIALCVTVGHLWRVLNEKYLMYMTLFAVLSPSFVELRNNLNRYDVLFCGLLLFFLSFIVINKKITIARLSMLSIGLMLIIISKYALLFPLFLFIVYYYLFEKKDYLQLGVATTFFIIIIGSQYNYEMLLYTVARYQLISSEGGATFSFLAQVPLIGYLFKYLFALLAPFPWHKANLLVTSSYGGNYFSFVMHVLSALFGIYFFSCLLIRSKKILFVDAELRMLVMYGLIMSSSILMGATGYHFYLLIYFPFFAPILAQQECRVFWGIPIGFVVAVEVAYILSQWFLRL